MAIAFDALVVGAGSAGCVLAARLSEDPARRVCLVEAGPDHRAADLPEALQRLGRAVAWPYEWGERVISSGGRELPYLRGRGVGGSSSINGGVALRPEPRDFAQWPAGWRWPEILPCFRRLETDLDFGPAEWHGSSGPIPILRWPLAEHSPYQRAFHDACVRLGLGDCADHNEPGTRGVGPIPMNRRGDRRVSAAQAYLEPARERANLEVRGESSVRRVVVEAGRATGVELARGEILRAGEVWLSAGVIQSPALLWRSGIGPREPLRRLGIPEVAHLPDVGRHWSDHVVVTFAAPIDRDAVPRGAPGLQSILRATAPGSDRTNDLQLTPWVRRDAGGRLELTLSVSLQLPDGHGSVAATGRDASDRALLEWPFPGLPENTRRLREGWRLAARIAEAMGVLADAAAARSVQDAGDAELDRRVAQEHAAFYHGVGTCRMGEPDAPGCVVDPGCRVRGVAGLRVVDASIAPAVPRTNTNLLVIALAERAAELAA